MSKTETWKFPVSLHIWSFLVIPLTGNITLWGSFLFLWMISSMFPCAALSPGFILSLMYRASKPKLAVACISIYPWVVSTFRTHLFLWIWPFSSLTLGYFSYCHTTSVSIEKTFLSLYPTFLRILSWEASSGYLICPLP